MTKSPSIIPLITRLTYVMDIGGGVPAIILKLGILHRCVWPGAVLYTGGVIKRKMEQSNSALQRGKFHWGDPQMDFIVEFPLF